MLSKMSFQKTGTTRTGEGMKDYPTIYDLEEDWIEDCPEGKSKPDNDCNECNDFYKCKIGLSINIIEARK